MQEDSLPTCCSARPWSVLAAICLSAVLPVLFVVFAVFVIVNVCSGNWVVSYPFVTAPLFAGLVVQLVMVEIGLWKGKNWARHWIIEFALLWLIVIAVGLMSGSIKGSAYLYAVVILVPVLSRVVPAILLVSPSARCWFKKVLGKD